MAVAVMIFPVMMIMMIAVRIGIIVQAACGESFRRGIRAAGHAGIQLYSCFVQRHPGASADSAADQGVRLDCLQKTGQCAMTASVGLRNLLPDNCPVFHVIQFELFGMAEVLEDFPLFVGYCNSHDLASFRH